jgi:hypothetical protein
MGKRAFMRSEAYCDGYGSLVCHCGGDLCVCGSDGEQCIGCEKCEREDDYYEDDPAPMPPSNPVHKTDSCK